MRACPAVATLLVVGGVAAGPAIAQTPKLLDTPTSLGAGAGIRAVSGFDGGITLAWSDKLGIGGRSYWAERLPLSPVVGAARPLDGVDPENTSMIDLARGASGLRAFLLEDHRRRDDGTKPLLLVSAPAGREPEPPVVLPMPERMPVGDPEIMEASRSVSVSSIAATPDGDVAVAGCETDYRAQRARLLVWFLRNGAPSLPSDFGGCGLPATVRADGRGSVLLLFTRPRSHDAGWHDLWLAERLPDAAGFAEAVRVNDARFNAYSPFSHPDLKVNARGDALAVFSGGGMSPGPVSVITRTQGGPWTQPRALSSIAVMKATGAIDAQGGLAAVWDQQSRIHSTVRRPGGDWEPTKPTDFSDTTFGRFTVSADPSGAILVLHADFFTNRLHALVRTPNGEYDADQPISPAGFNALDPSVAVDPYGNGLITYTVTRGPLGPSAVAATPIGTGPPQLDGVKLDGTSELRLRSSEPARVGIEALADGGRRARQSTPAGVAPVRIKLSPAMRRTLKRRGARLLIRARDATDDIARKRLRPRHRRQGR